MRSENTVNVTEILSNRENFNPATRISATEKVGMISEWKQKYRPTAISAHVQEKWPKHNKMYLIDQIFIFWLGVYK